MLSDAGPINWSVTLNFILKSQQLIRQGNPFANDKEAKQIYSDVDILDKYITLILTFRL